MEKERHTCRDTQRDVKVNAFLKTLAERLAVEGHVAPDRLANKLAATLEKMEAKTIGGRLRDVVTEALVDRTG